MITAHPSDKILQEYAAAHTDERTAVAEHLHHCTACRMKVSQYRLLFDTLPGLKKPVFDFNLADTVIRQIAEQRSTVSNNDSSYYSILLIACTCGIGLFSFLLYKTGPILFAEGTLLTTVAIATAGLLLLSVLATEIIKKHYAQIKTLDQFSHAAT